MNQSKANPNPTTWSGAPYHVRSQELLPPAHNRALELEEEVYPRVSSTISELLYRELGPEDRVYFLARTRSRVDVGTWFVNRPIWVFALQDALLSLSCPWTHIGSKPYVDRSPYTQLRQSLYNHITGSLVLAPAIENTHCHLTLAPNDAYQLLAQIYLEDRA